MDDEARKAAEALFEKHLGYPVSPKEVTELIRLEKYGFELKQKPFISLLSVQARTEKWGDYGVDLGQSIWIDIPIEQTHVFKHDSITLLAVPPTLFGTVYTEVRATYIAGLTELPERLERAIQTVEIMIQKGELDSWNRQLPLDVLEVIDSYKKEDK
jgi:hypothetical protein